ncbi:hypothetical protein M0R45_022520 [Rubus argutus]|uniref:F-box/LRR-repeat protein 15/At3g58940/PEG3-like LRR domain-containing protein n=1 Tax=Rubus argutus TaxID=59490 RepID=A0AAW1XI68_RUBAR
MRVDPTQRLLSLSESLEQFYADWDFYRLPWLALFNAKSLTSLNLECVAVPVRVGFQSHKHLFPSLKTLSFTTVCFFDDQVLFSVLRECPSLEYLSLTECSFGKYSKCYVPRSSLKSLEVKYCWLQDLRVHEAKNLESFTFVSRPPTDSICRKVILNNALNLKNINICVHYLWEFSLLGCRRAQEATINAQQLNHFVEAYQAIILVWELLDEEWFPSDWTHFPRLMSFLKQFSCCRVIYIYNQDVQALIIPKKYRKMTSFPPLPTCSIVQVRMPNPPTVESRDYMELVDSLQWIAPSACISIRQVDVEQHRNQVDQRARPIDQ